MNIWVLLIKNDEIVGGGRNIVFDGTFDRVIPTTEQFARQGTKLELVDGELRVKDGMTIKTVEELNQDNLAMIEDIVSVGAEPELELVTPVNL